MKLLPISLSFTIVALLLTACERLPMEEEFALHYFTSTEGSYTDIKLEQGQLTYTYFEDTENRCAQWFKSTPCWTQADLKTVTAPLDAETEKALRNLVNEQKLLEAKAVPAALKTAQGQASPERAYSEKLDIRLGQNEQQLVYLSRPDAPPKPESFQQIEQVLQAAVQKLKIPTT
ncbi:hypothetical protein [uncultured Thiothrix sp.]|uniref:hypothetical protein n=1 Tax=uncultured Thiothrix sp. TaxID=223185 RepID=UPI0026181E80|nr:hypothetical protein [uncultured Thiothrix sp.]